MIAHARSNSKRRKAAVHLFKIVLPVMWLPHGCGGVERPGMDTLSNVPGQHFFESLRLTSAGGWTTRVNKRVCSIAFMDHPQGAEGQEPASFQQNLRKPHVTSHDSHKARVRHVRHVCFPFTFG